MEGSSLVDCSSDTSVAAVTPQLSTSASLDSIPLQSAATHRALAAKHRASSFDVGTTRRSLFPTASDDDDRSRCRSSRGQGGLKGSSPDGVDEAEVAEVADATLAAHQAESTLPEPPPRRCRPASPVPVPVPVPPRPSHDGRRQIHSAAAQEPTPSATSRRASRAEVYGAQYRELAAAAAAIDMEELACDGASPLPLRVSATAEQLAAARAATKAEQQVKQEAIDWAADAEQVARAHEREASSDEAQGATGMEHAADGTVEAEAEPIGACGSRARAAPPEVTPEVTPEALLHVRVEELAPAEAPSAIIAEPEAEACDEVTQSAAEAAAASGSQEGVSEEAAAEEVAAEDEEAVEEDAMAEEVAAEDEEAVAEEVAADGSIHLVVPSPPGPRGSPPREPPQGAPPIHLVVPSPPGPEPIAADAEAANLEVATDHSAGPCAGEPAAEVPTDAADVDSASPPSVQGTATSSATSKVTGLAAREMEGESGIEVLHATQSGREAARCLLVEAKAVPRPAADSAVAGRRNVADMPSQAASVEAVEIREHGPGRLGGQRTRLLGVFCSVLLLPSLLTLDWRATKVVQRIAVGPVVRNDMVGLRTRPWSIEAMGSRGGSLGGSLGAPWEGSLGGSLGGVFRGAPTRRGSAHQPAPLSLRSPHDGLCLLHHPLRFGPCEHPDLLILFSSGGRRLRPLHADSFLRISLWAGNGASNAPPPFIASPAQSTERSVCVCADRRCFRCLTRGNANRARIGLCALDGFEALRIMPALPSSLVDRLFHWMTLSQVLSLLAIMGMAVYHVAFVRQVDETGM